MEMAQEMDRIRTDAALGKKHHCQRNDPGPAADAEIGETFLK
jgi:hypothetical protein